MEELNSKISKYLTLIHLVDPNVAICRLHLERRICFCSDHKAQRVWWLCHRALPGFETVHDPAGRGLGCNRGGRVAGENCPNARVLARCFDRKLLRVPPIVGHVEAAIRNRKVQIAKAIVRAQPAIDEVNGGASTPEAFD